MYQPSIKILRKYADVLVNFALNSGKGVKPGEVVLVRVPDWAKLLYEPLQTAILQAGSHPLFMLEATGVERAFWDIANEKQATFFPGDYWKGLVDQVDHIIMIRPMITPNELEGVDPTLMQKQAEAFKPVRVWRNDKEYAGKQTWTIGWFGTQEYADEVGMTLEEYWAVIIEACYLDQEDPVAEWQKAMAEIQRVRDVLNSIEIDRLHVEGKNVDLWMTLGEKRLWVGGSGRNIPSFELFTSPDWRGTNGTIFFNQPLYYNGYKIEGIRLVFKDGLVIEANAETNQKVLLERIKNPDADKIGEFSLNDGRLSRISKVMANTLFDENMGGPEGNTHLALGMAYQDTQDGDTTAMSLEDGGALGFNDVNCATHTDIISTEKRVVTAILHGGEEMVIYENGQFTIQFTQIFRAENSMGRFITPCYAWTTRDIPKLIWLIAS